MPPLFKLPLLYGLRFGQCQRVCHRPGAQVLGLRIQMRVDIRRGGNIAVTQPLLNSLPINFPKVYGSDSLLLLDWKT